MYRPADYGPFLSPPGGCFPDLGADDGDQQEAGLTGTGWVAGGLVLAMAVAVYILDKKGPPLPRIA
jgi:hypothetical protein